MNPDPTAIPGPGDVLDAQAFFERDRIVDRTQLVGTSTISAETRSEAFFKAENLQRTGSFKIRGAAYKISKLSGNARKAGVIAASLGNHAQGVASAAQRLRIPCTIVMPTDAALAKIEATRKLGAIVELRGATYDDAQAAALEMQAATGATFIHAFDDPEVIAGQGTIGLEIVRDLPSVEAIIVPIGGGGLISGIAIAAKAANPRIQIIGVQAEGAPSAKLSFDNQRMTSVPNPHTIADGISTKQPGKLTLEIMLKYVDKIVLVREDEIARSVVWLLERAKLLVEGAGAASVAALRYHADELKLRGKRVVSILSGGNVDATALDRFIRYGMAAEGRILTLDIVLPDHPGALGTVLTKIAEKNVNVLEIIHQRAIRSLNPQEARVTLILESLNNQQGRGMVQYLRDANYQIEVQEIED